MNLRNTLLWPFRLIWALLQLVATAAAGHRRQNVLDEREAERLDRIRNPSKYLGKDD